VLFFVTLLASVSQLERNILAGTAFRQVRSAAALRGSGSLDETSRAAAAWC